MFEEPREAISTALASLKHLSKETFQQRRQLLFHGSKLIKHDYREKNEDVGNSEEVKMKKKLIFCTYNERAYKHL